MKRPSPKGQFEVTKPGNQPSAVAASAEVPSADLLVASSAVSLRTQETGKFVNINSGGWAEFGDTSTTKYLLVRYGSEGYIVIADGKWKGYYLSYNNYSYIGAYSGWSDARYFSLDPVDCSLYPGLYPYNNYMCCNGVRDAIDKIVTVVGY